jgi:hypothetical protein
MSGSDEGAREAGRHWSQIKAGTENRRAHTCRGEQGMGEISSWLRLIGTALWPLPSRRPPAVASGHGGRQSSSTPVLSCNRSEAKPKHRSFDYWHHLAIHHAGFTLAVLTHDSPTTHPRLDWFLHHGTYIVWSIVTPVSSSGTYIHTYIHTYSTSLTLTLITLP